MRSARGWIILSLCLGTLSLLWLIADYLALKDIRRGIEPDLRTEWGIVGYGFYPLILFHLVALITLGKVLGRRRAEPVR